MVNNIEILKVLNIFVRWPLSKDEYFEGFKYFYSFATIAIGQGNQRKIKIFCGKCALSVASSTSEGVLMLDCYT